MLKNKKPNILYPVIGELNQSLKDLEKIASTTEKGIGSYVVPVRNSILKRFPVIFLLLVTFGLSATILGLERIIIEYKLFGDSPTVIFLVGVFILALTGTLYKKLG